MEDGRLQTDLWVAAVLRQCNSKAVPVYVYNKGSSESGTIVVKVVINTKTCRVFSQTRDDDGNLAWMDIYDGETVDESRGDAYINRALERDPDLWVLEVEDASGKNPFEGKVI